jgi:hypothetical protein
MLYLPTYSINFPINPCNLHDKNNDSNYYKMLTRLTVTNILGARDIDNDTPFITVSSEDLHKYLKVIKYCNPHTIYRIKYKELARYIQKSEYSVDMRNFMPVGDICSADNITSLLLANKHMVATTTNYRNIGKMNGMYMWVGYIKRQGRESRSIGVITTETNNPPRYPVPVLPRMYLIKMDFGTGFIRGNDFDILSVKSDGLWIVTRNRFKEGSLYQNSLTSQDRSGRQVVDNSSYAKDFTKLVYNENGQLLINDKCLTVDKHGKIKMRTCSKSKSQKWIRSGNNYVSMYNGRFNKCIGQNSSGSLVLKEYILNTNWNDTNRYDSDKIEDWKSVKGKALVLKDRANPWFLDKNVLNNSDKIHFY